MDWQDEGRSSDLEDRRGDSGGSGFGGFGFGGIHLGIGGFLIVAVLSLIFRTNLFSLLGGGGAPVASTQQQARPVDDPAEEKEVHFVSFVLDDTQKTWTTLLQQKNIAFPHAKLVLYRNATQAGCGFAQSATGPFYCPEDKRVYLDLEFFDELTQKFGAPGQFAQAYVIAHEIGHHVQDVLGTLPKVDALMRRNPSQKNALSVRLELQADCYAGVWGSTTQQRGLLGQGEAQQAMKAAASVGDDRLQRAAGRTVSPESFTHGSSEQRMHWFNAGLKGGTVGSCNTFAAAQK